MKKGFFLLAVVLFSSSQALALTKSYGEYFNAFYSSSNASSCYMSNVPSGYTVYTPTANANSYFTYQASNSGTFQITCSNSFSSASANDYLSVVFSDLTASTITPTTATSNVATTFSTTISNIGSGSTLSAFSVLFQKATDSSGTGATDIGTVNTSLLNANQSSTVSYSYTFPSPGTYYMRACADKNSAGDAGVITESNEGNNCSSQWTAVTVPNPAAAGNFLIFNCTILKNQSSCSSSYSWQTTNATRTVTISEPTVFGTILTANPSKTQGTSIPLTLTPPGDYTFTMYHGTDFLKNRLVTVACASGTYWDGSKCKNNPAGIVDDHLTCNYTSPCSIYLKCNGASDTYSISRDGVILVNKQPYTGPVTYPVSTEGNYSISCENDTGPIIDVFYYSPNPQPSNLSLTATPRTVESGGKVVFTWSITNPSMTCAINATPVCTGSSCSAAQINDASALNSIFASSTTDSNDPYGASRPMATALHATSSTSSTKALGKKTVQMTYTTDFALSCKGATSTSTVRVITSKNNEG